MKQFMGFQCLFVTKSVNLVSMQFVENTNLGCSGTCEGCGSTVAQRDKFISNRKQCEDQHCDCCQKFLCDNCTNCFYSQDKGKNIPYCTTCYEGLQQSMNRGDLKIYDNVSLHWLKTKEVNNTLGAIVAMPNEVGRYAVLVASPKKKTLLIKKENVVLLDNTVNYHPGRRVCSFCGAECDCGAFDEEDEDQGQVGVEKIRMHSQSCHHYMNTLRRKGPDCTGFEPMEWNCCRNQCNDIGCEFTGRDGPFDRCNVFRMYPGDMKFRCGPKGEFLSDTQRRALAKQAEVDMWERVKAGKNPF